MSDVVRDRIMVLICWAFFGIAVFFFVHEEFMLAYGALISSFSTALGYVIGKAAR